MGVPITYMDKHDPDEFKIIDLMKTPSISGKLKYARILIQRKPKCLFCFRLHQRQFVYVDNITTKTTWDKIKEDFVAEYARECGPGIYFCANPEEDKEEYEMFEFAQSGDSIYFKKKYITSIDKLINNHK